MKEKINQYLAGDLEGEALEEFEELLSKNSQLRAEVEHKEQLLEDSILEGGQYYHELQSIVYQIHEKAEKEQQEKPIRQLSPKRSLKKYLAAAATIAFIILAYCMWNQAPTKGQIIAQAESSIPTALPLTKGAMDDIALLEAKVEQAFAKQEYEETKQLCLQILEQDSSKTIILFAKAICELRLENYPAAIQDFEAVEATNVVFKIQATWLKGITHLKKGELSTCRQVMENLANSKNIEYKEKAQVLLKQLDGLD